MSRDFSENIKVITGYKDAFNHSVMLLVNEDMKEIRTVGKNPDYRAAKKKLEKHKNIVVPKYLEVIDITLNTYNKIMSKYKGYSHTQWQIW